MSRALQALAEAAAAAGLAILLSPTPLWAWGPGTHIYIGTELLAAVSLLSPTVARLIRRHPYDFLYGCIAPDIPFAKKYAPADRHCHHWHIGEEIYEFADTDERRACALGYLTHLAGDTIAHNVFLPRRLLTSASTQSIGHSYWEHRMDIHLGDPYIQAARRLITEFDHRENDEMLNEVLARTVFSFETNRRIFRGMIHVANHNTWQAVFDRVLDYSRWDVEDGEVRMWTRYTFEYAADYLIRRDNSFAAQLDPTGKQNLLLARQLRRQVGVRKAPRRDELEELAEANFPLPHALPGRWHLRRLASGIEIRLLDPPRVPETA